jgi:uncharacterized protein (TIGR00159 family)
MQHLDCDVSPLKEQLRENLQAIADEIRHSLETLDHENNCLLGKFAQIKERFIQMEAAAASFYLYCYLSPYTDKYADLSISLQHLSARRHGALIVIQRNDPLDELIQPGIPIGAAITHSLLESIFLPGSPLHDGAVLIRSQQIVSAAHILPLSDAIVGERKLGTRHRAALGLTERSDALVLVVSEETGRVSFAINGTLYPVSFAQLALA